MRGYDPIPEWRHTQRLAYDESLKVERDARFISRALAVFGLLLLVTVIW